MIDRRVLLLVPALAALASPAAAQSQRPGVPVIGFLGSASRGEWRTRLQAFLRGLQEAGMHEGRNFEIEYRWADNRNERFPALAAELVARRVDLIVVLGNTSSVLAAKAATSSIPIVFRVAADPVAIGLVASLSRPGGNLTGVSTLGATTGPKQLELMRDLIPGIRRIALLVNPGNPVLVDALKQTVPAAARDLGLELHILAASSDADLPPVFSELARLRVDALVVGVDAYFNSRNELLAELSLKHALPTISPYREFAEAGGLMSYGGNIADGSRLAGVYAGRILRGEKPSDLPVQQVARIELILNKKTAKALGVPVAEAFEARADEVLE